MTNSAIQQKAYPGLGLALMILLLGAGGYALSQEPPSNPDSATLVSANGAQILKVESGRPLERAAQVLQALYGYVITYEDPRYTNEDDVVDTAASVMKNYAAFRSGSAPKLLVPKANRLTLKLPTTPSIESTDLAKLLSELIGQQGTSAHGGHFRLMQTGDVFHIVPAHARDRAGNWQPQISLLDTRISLPQEDRTDGQLYRAIAAAVSSATQVSISVQVNSPIVMGQAPQPQRTNIGAADEPARSVLIRALALSPVKRTWILMHTTEEGSNSFSLNIIDLPTEVSSQLY